MSKLNLWAKKFDEVAHIVVDGESRVYCGAYNALLGNNYYHGLRVCIDCQVKMAEGTTEPKTRDILSKELSEKLKSIAKDLDDETADVGQTLERMRLVHLQVSKCLIGPMFLLDSIALKLKDI